MFRFARNLVTASGATALVLATFWVPGSAMAAGSKSGTLTVNATVAASCTVSDATLDFGTVSYTSDTTANVDVDVACTNTTAYSVAMSGGNNTTGTGTAITRAMDDGAGNNLSYQLYTEATNTNVWIATCAEPVDANCIGGTGSGLGTADTVTVYGLVASGQDVTPGSYTDSVTMTVSY